MDTIITRIIEIEKQTALGIKQAEEASRKKIEAFRRSMQKGKEEACARILSAENQKLTEALEVLNQKTEKALREARAEYEERFQDSGRINAVKEKIIAILLAG